MNETPRYQNKNSRKSASNAAPTFKPHPRYPRLSVAEPSTNRARKARQQRVAATKARSSERPVIFASTVPGGSSVMRGISHSFKTDFTPGRVISLLGFVGLLVLGWWLLTAPNFRVTDIKVKGSRYLDAAGVVAATRVNEENVFLLDEAKITNELKKKPYVISVKVSKSLPNQLAVEVVERQTALTWKVGSQNYLVDKDGRILEATATLPASAQDFPAVKSLDDKQLKIGDDVDVVAVQSAPEMMSKLTAAGYKVNSLDYSPQNGLLAQLTINGGNYRVLLGTNAELDRKMELLKGIMATPNLKWSFADLRFTKKPAVQ